MLGTVKIEEAVPLSRFTTIGTGGPALALARPRSLPELEQALAWAAERGLPVATVGLGSNLLVADAACVTEVYAAREEPSVSGRTVVDGLSEARPGMTIGWAPALEDGARIVAGWARPGDLVLVAGAGDVDKAVPLILEALG